MSSHPTLPPTASELTQPSPELGLEQLQSSLEALSGRLKSDLSAAYDLYRSEAELWNQGHPAKSPLAGPFKNNDERQSVRLAYREAETHTERMDRHSFGKLLAYQLSHIGDLKQFYPSSGLPGFQALLDRSSGSGIDFEVKGFEDRSPLSPFLQDACLFFNDGIHPTPQKLFYRPPNAPNHDVMEAYRALSAQVRLFYEGYQYCSSHISPKYGAAILRSFYTYLNGVIALINTLAETSAASSLPLQSSLHEAVMAHIDHASLFIIRHREAQQAQDLESLKSTPAVEGFTPIHLVPPDAISEQIQEPLSHLKEDLYLFAQNPAEFIRTSRFRTDEVLSEDSNPLRSIAGIKTGGAFRNVRVYQ